MTDEEPKELLNDELKELSIIYRQLLDFKPFQRLVEEMKKQVEEYKEDNISNREDNLYDKGVVEGIRTAINEPLEIVKVFENSQTRE